MVEKLMDPTNFVGKRFRCISLFLLTLVLSIVIGESAVYSQCAILPPASPSNLTVTTVSTLPTPQITPNVSGLVAHWKFDEGSGTNACDSSGNGNTGTLANGPQWTAGKVGSALYFDGVNDNVVVAAANSLDLSGSFTLSAWVSPAATFTDWITILAKNYKYYLYASVAGFCGNGSPVGGFYEGTDVLACQPSPLPANTWTYLTVAYNGSTITLYRNGVSVATYDTSVTLSPTTGTLQIGASQYGEYFKGFIDEVRVYQRALSDTEVLSIYQQGSGNASQTVATPLIVPNGGNFSGSVPLDMQTATSGASIYYTVDGSTPTESSTLYAAPVTLTGSAVVKTKAFKSGLNASSEASASFTINQTFNFSASSSGDISVNPGSSVTNSITATLLSGSSQPVSFSVSGLPSGATAFFSSGTCNPDCSTLLTFETSSSTPGGSFPITLTATGGGMIRTTAFAFIVVLAVLPPPATGNTYYVATNGSDSYSCSQARNISTPKRNIMGSIGGISCLVAGDTLDIRGGTYREHLDNYVGTTFISGTAANPVTVRGHAGETVTVGGIDIKASVPLAYWIFDNLIINGTLTGSNAGRDAFYTGKMDHVIVRNSEIKNGPRMNVGGGGSNNLFQNLTIRDAGRDSVPHYDYGVYYWGHDTVFEYIHLYDNPGYGFHIYNSGMSDVSNNIVRYSVIHNNGGTEPANAAIIISSGPGNKVYGNVVYNNRNGIAVDGGCHNCVVYNNTVYGNSANGTEGIGTNNSNNVSIRNNILRNNGANGINVRGGTGHVISNNHCDSAASGCVTTGDALFLDPTAGNFAIKLGSPAIDRGTTLTDVPGYDIINTPRPQRLGWDIGAYEFR